MTRGSGKRTVKEEVWEKSCVLKFMVVKFQLIIRYWCVHERFAEVE